MDATLKNFLNEINEIAPPEPKTRECHWQECFDESSGFPYYWNVRTNAVTWEIPDEYKDYLESSKSSSAATKPREIVTAAPLFPSTATLPDEKETDTLHENKLKKTKRKIANEMKDAKSGKVKRRESSESEDEKIVLISSYGGDTESENEDNEETDNEEERCKERTEDKLTPNVRNSEEIKEVETVAAVKPIKEIKPVTGFSLLAAYADSEEEEEQSKESEETDEKTSHSTLFPVVKPIDVKQFEPKANEYLDDSLDADLEKKAFQRKRRIGVSLINKKYVKDEDGERKGFGFKSEPERTEDAEKGGKYGISFVKCETLNGDADKSEEKDMEEAQKELREKLGFLAEGRDEVSPVQIMQIQLETLYAAYADGSLNSSYLNRWLKETCEGLIKLEEAATPSGWLLQWDRGEKRYYYRNKVSDECQWDYPQLEDDAMDICTTPPPPLELEDGELAGTPSPPPTIIITQPELVVPPSEIVNKVNQPLPPGVEESQDKDLNSVLNSFYTDIAALETSQQVTGGISKPALTEELATSLHATEIVPSKEVKKKKKVKVASMKKKNVSKLVEKWNNVQKDLN